MYDSDPFVAALGGRPITPDRVEAARALLLMLRNLVAEVSGAVPGSLPSGLGRWRSAAAERYSQRLDELRNWAVGARQSLEDAEAQLVDRIRRMEAQLDVQAAQAARTAEAEGVERVAGVAGTPDAAPAAAPKHPAPSLPSADSRRTLARNNELGAALWTTR
ncbi:hypothetical protein [Agromyces ramosus]|uniref:Uncharacterized protein n=1 Tax=Agromyces ramosus TaxID=33879 RepID=A0ABU0R7I1_9MICO|nr:hypothetical protein [Agromyces ramosus]MDQ0894029.1 hypothetical protein [Agromyces ramosus]